MIVRLLAAAVALAIVLPALAFGGELAVEVLAPLVGLVCVHEYRKMAMPDSSMVELVALFVGASALYLSAVYAPAYLGAMLGLTGIGVLIVATLDPGEALEEGPASAGRMFFGILWIGALLPSIPLLRGLDGGLGWLCLVLVVTWSADTGAYFAGRSFGRKKLYERVSPKKTWEGVYGGMAAAVCGVFLMDAFWLETLGVVECVVLGLSLSALGVLGDLAESLVKRTYGVKDSGNIMPGHGGLLDRIDSLLFVAPALYGYLLISAG
jgi:phosphatidate cytidylyltransferase